MDKETHLKSTYGFNKFRDYQKEIIDDILDKENVFAILPTGGGKSLLYQYPATYTNKITIVVSPLISLMNDQCIYLNSKNISSVCLNSETNISVSEYKNYKIIYATPEFITSRISKIEKIKEFIGLFAIDEAHCVSQWSHDFRESYLELGIIKKTFPEIPILAVTATATPRVVEDIYDLLNIDEACEYMLGTRRTNLAISILPQNDFEYCTFTEPTIVYVQTRKICESLYEKISNKGIKCAHYHGGMSKNDKEDSHNLFANGEIMVIVATISFGMGIDKSDIRHVVNYGVPTDIETYYQEIGRAGRDGLMSKATMYYDLKNFNTVKFLINQSSDPKQIEIKTNGMNLLRKFIDENNICRQQVIDYYFEKGSFPTEEDVANIPKCKLCDNCLGVKKDDIRDISDETKHIINMIKNQKRVNGFSFGMSKTVDMIKHKDNPLFNNRSKIWIKELIQILIGKNILISYHKGFGFIIDVGKKNIDELIPIKARISNDIQNSLKNFTINTGNDTLEKLYELRVKMAEAQNVNPTTFINDRVILNIHDSKPKTLTALWAIDGISDEFVMNYGTELIEELKKINKKSKNNSKETCNQKNIINNVNNLSDENISIFINKLKKYRLEEAKKNDIPPFCVYYDTTINDIISKCPTNNFELFNVKGFGIVKVEKYGKEIINICLEILSNNKKLRDDLSDDKDNDNENDNDNRNDNDNDKDNDKDNDNNNNNSIEDINPTIKWFIHNNSNHIFQISKVKKKIGTMAGMWSIKIRGPNVNNKKDFKIIYSQPNDDDALDKSSKFINVNISDIKPIKSIDIIYKYYKDGKTIDEIVELTGRKSKDSIENDIYKIFEQYEDVDIDPEYFGLTEEYEEEIKDVVKNIGSEYLKPIKDAVNNKITYGQIKLCLLIIKIESEE